MACNLAVGGNASIAVGHGNRTSLFGYDATRRHMVMWKSGGLHNFIKLCKTHNCYKPTIICKCNLHVLDADQLRHIDECAWAVAGDNHRHIIISPRREEEEVFILRYLV